jgi:hypothetical protein
LDGGTVDLRTRVSSILAVVQKIRRSENFYSTYHRTKSKCIDRDAAIKSSLKKIVLADVILAMAAAAVF